MSENVSLQVVVPNLDRRPDRWSACLGELLKAGFPEAQIRRVSSMDGSLFNSQDEIHAEIRSLYNDDLPPYFSHSHEWRHPTNTAWLYTWYNIVSSIASGTKPTLLLIDDWMLQHVSYNDMCTHLMLLNGRPESLKIIQYSWWASQPHEEWMKYPPVVSGEVVVQEAPDIHFGLKGSGDYANVYSPQGARDMLEYTAYYPDLTPDILHQYFSYERPAAGCYSAAQVSAINIPYISHTQDRRGTI